MNNKNSKLVIWIAVIFEILFIITSIYNILSGKLKKPLLLLIASIFILFPFIITYIANKKDILLPPNFQLTSLSFILFSQYFGEILKFYTMFWWWDLLLHGAFGIYTVIIPLYLMQGIIIKEKGISKKRFVILTIILAFCFSIALGTLWEMIEFIGDYLFKTNMVKGGLEDTASDILIS